MAPVPRCNPQDGGAVDNRPNRMGSAGIAEGAALGALAGIEFNVTAIMGP